MPEWVGTREASERLGITLRTLYRLIDEGEMPAYKMGRVIRLKSEDVMAYRADPPGDLRHLYPDGDRDGGPAGVREPRIPRPPAPAGSMELDLPE